MEHKNEFVKLFGYNIPIFDHFDYYIETLSKSKDFENIYQKANLFESYETFLKSINDIPKHYKFDVVSSLILNYFKSSTAYKNLENYAFTQNKLQNFDNSNSFDDKMLLSVDLSSANYQVFKCLDTDNEFPDTWYNLLTEKLNVHKCIAESKSYRQYILGNLNPKRINKLHHELINIIVDDLKLIIGDDNIVAVLTDEFILCEVNQSNYSTVLSAINESFTKISNRLNYKTKLFKFNSIPNHPSVKIQSIYDNDFNLSYTRLHGCPGNLFFWYFKQYILKEKVEPRDLLFLNDGKLASWVV